MVGTRQRSTSEIYVMIDAVDITFITVRIKEQTRYGAHQNDGATMMIMKSLSV